VSDYRTEFIIPPDRYICLQLPPHLPEGRATITVTVHDRQGADEAPPLPEESEAVPESDIDQQDIEWWEEFELP
jgi:hypothetical protein